MPVDLSNPSGFNQHWVDVVTQFRKEAIDDHLSGGNLDVINDHITGPVDPQTLAAQYAFPVVWSLPTSHSPAYDTVATDHGALDITVTVFAADTDAETAYQKARELGGRIVNNVEGSALVNDQGDAEAARVDLTQFDMDTRPATGNGAQVKYSEANYQVQTERNY